MPRQPDSQIQKVIDSSELDKHTSTGWTVIDSFMVDEQICYTDEVAHPRAGEKIENNGGYGMHGSNHAPQSVILHRMKVGQVLKFRVAKGIDTRISEMEEKLKGINEHYSKVMNENVGLKKWKGDAEKAYEELQKERDEEKVRYSNTYSAKCKLEDRVRVMEKDIAKIRKAIGDKQMREILKGN